MDVRVLDLDCLVGDNLAGKKKVQGFDGASTRRLRSHARATLLRTDVVYAPPGSSFSVEVRALKPLPPLAEPDLCYAVFLTGVSLTLIARAPRRGHMLRCMRSGWRGRRSGPHNQ